MKNCKEYKHKRLPWIAKETDEKDIGDEDDKYEYYIHKIGEYRCKEEIEYSEDWKLLKKKEPDIEKLTNYYIDPEQCKSVVREKINEIIDSINKRR